MGEAVPCERAGRVTEVLRNMRGGQIALDKSWLEDRCHVMEGWGPWHAARGSRVP